MNEVSDVKTRLDDLAKLSAGWLDGKSEPLDPAALHVLAQDFDTYFDPDLPLPYLYPTAEGGIQAEWTLRDWEVSLKIQLPARAAQYQALHLPTDQVDEQTLSLVQGQGEWIKLNALLKGLLEGTV